MTEKPTTGHPAVDAALQALEQLDAAPVHHHVAVFDEVHGALLAALTSPATSSATTPATNPATTPESSPLTGSGPSAPAAR